MLSRFFKLKKITIIINHVHLRTMDDLVLIRHLSAMQGLHIADPSANPEHSQIWNSTFRCVTCMPLPLWLLIVHYHYIQINFNGNYSFYLKGKSPKSIKYSTAPALHKSTFSLQTFNTYRGTCKVDDCEVLGRQNIKSLCLSS